MIEAALAPRALFFKGAPAILPLISQEMADWFWWFAIVIGIWTLVSILFGVFLWRHVATWLWGPKMSEEERTREELVAMEKWRGEQRKRKERSREK